MACGDQVVSGGVANRLNLGLGDIHIKSPDPSIVVEEIEWGLDVLRVFALNKSVIYEGFVGRRGVCSHEVSEESIEV